MPAGRLAGGVVPHREHGLLKDSVPAASREGLSQTQQGGEGSLQHSGLPWGPSFLRVNREGHPPGSLKVLITDTPVILQEVSQCNHPLKIIIIGRNSTAFLSTFTVLSALLVPFC